MFRKEFVNREKELEFLNKKYREGGFEFIIISGRRRIGKSRLLKEFVKDKDGENIFLLCEFRKWEHNLSKFNNKPNILSIFSLKKKCLTRFLQNEEKDKININKYDLAHYLWAVRKNECTRECLKEIVTCGNTCNTYCPILKYIEKQ